jgi:dTDP-glucose 4,6-dehydratase
MKVLITGGAGFVGANFVHYLLRERPGTRVVVLDALTYAGNRSNLPIAKSSALRFVQGNICDATLVEALLREEHIDTIVHFAAESYVDAAVQRPDAFLETNVIGTHCLLRCARKIWLLEQSIDRHHFHHVSTDIVFGDKEEILPPATANYAPNTPYGASKVASDVLVRTYHQTYGLKTTTSNCSNAYGPLQYPERLIPRMIVRCLLGKTLPVYGEGSNTRDWIHINDLCHALDLMLTRSTPGEAYPVGGNSERRNIDVVRHICSAINEAFIRNPSLKQQFPHCLAALGRDTSSSIHLASRPDLSIHPPLDCSKTKRTLGYHPSVSFEEGLNDTIQWYASNHWWWAWTAQDAHVSGDDTTPITAGGSQPSGHASIG